SWRVASESSAAPRRAPIPRPAPCAASWTALTSSGANPRSRSSPRAWRGESASITPRASCPAASAASYRYAGTGEPSLRRLFARHAQHFVGRRDARFDPAPAVLAHRAHSDLARPRANLVLGCVAMDLRACRVVDDEQLVDPGASLEARP